MRTRSLKNSIMKDLPVEIISHIISFLDIFSQLRVAAVSRRWRAASEFCLRGRRRLTDEDLPRSCTGDKLSALLPRLPALRTLRFPFRISSFNLDVVAKHCQRLEDLDLSPFEQNSASAELLQRCFPRLTALHLPECCRDAHVTRLLRQLPGLRELSLEETQLSTESVALLPAGLRLLDLSGCSLPAELADQPADRWPELRQLFLAYAGGSTGHSLAALVAGCSGLDRLVARVSEATDDLLRKLPALPQLRRLDLSYCDVFTEAGLADCLGRLKRLEILNLEMVGNLTDEVLGRLADAEALSILILGVGDWFSMPFSINGVKRLVLARPSLTSLRIYKWKEDLQDLQTLIADLACQLSPERDVELSIPERFLGTVDRSVLPPGGRPLRLTSSNRYEDCF